MRKVAQKAKVSTTAFYRHFKNKDDLKAELMRRGYQIINEGRENISTFSSYGAHYIRFGLDYPFIYDLMFGNINLDLSLYPDLETESNESFDGILEGLKIQEMNKLKNWIHIKKDGNENADIYLRQQAAKFYTYGQYPSIQLLNPMAWAKFFEAWKNGDFKNKKD